MPSGVVFRVEPDLFFLPADVAERILPAPEITRVPGGPPELLGVALAAGELVPVIGLGEAGAPSQRAMVVCALRGERIGLVGIHVLATGTFEALEGGVRYEGAIARPFDLAPLLADVREGRWAV